MWIHYIGEIAMAAFVALIALHFAVHLYFKFQKRNKKSQVNEC